MVDAENGQRGFLLTEQPEYLDPLLEAAPRIHDVLVGSRAATAHSANDAEPGNRAGTADQAALRDPGQRVCVGYVRGAGTAVSRCYRGNRQAVMDAMRGRVGSSRRRNPTAGESVVAMGTGSALHALEPGGCDRGERDPAAHGRRVPVPRYEPAQPRSDRAQADRGCSALPRFVALQSHAGGRGARETVAGAGAA